MKAHLREKYPKAHRFLSKLSKWASRESRLNRLNNKLPDGYRIQKIRHPHVYMGNNDTYLKFIDGYIKYNYDNYGVTLDPVRVVSLIEAALLSNSIDGEIAECGVYQGSSTKILHSFCNPNKKIHLFDTFSGFTEEDLEIEKVKGSLVSHGQPHVNTSISKVRKNLEFPIDDAKPISAIDRVMFHVGFVPETFKNVKSTSFSLVHLDLDLYQPTLVSLNFFIPRLSKYGILVLHDYAVPKDGYIGVFKAFEDSEHKQAVYGPLPFGDQSSALFIKI